MDEKYLNQAKKLHDTVKGTRRLAKGFTGLIKWAVEFEMLARDQKHNIDQILDWYIKHMEEEYVPKAYSARSFRMKFRQIVAAFDKDPDATTIKLSSTEQIILNSMKEWEWPVEIKSNLSAIVHKSWENQTTFKEVIWNNRGLDQRIWEFLMFVLNAHGPITQEWLDDLYGKYKRKEHCTSNLKFLAFYPDSEAFKNMWRGWSNDWCCQPNAFDKLLKELILKWEKRK